MPADRNKILCMTEAEVVGRRPDWAAPCFRFMDYLVQVDELISLTNEGVSHLTKIPRILELSHTALNSAKDKKEVESQKKAKKRAQLAKSEIEKDFPLLHSHAVMGMWGALEAMVEDLAISWIEHNQSVLDEPKIAKIRVPLVEFQLMDQQDRLRFVVSELQRDLGTDLKSGATKFESFLNVLGLGGPVDKRLRDIIFETQSLRNIFAHRGGIADRRFITGCPQFQYKVGDTVTVNSDHFNRIFYGLLMYATVIVNRCRVIDSLPLITEDIPGYEGVLLASTKIND